MNRLKTILALILTVAIAAAGVPMYAKSECAMMADQHQGMVKDCPNCAEKSDNQARHKDKCCGSMECAIGCSSVISMNAPADATSAFLPVVHKMDATHPSDTTVISFFTLTQERPPKHLA